MASYRCLYLLTKCYQNARNKNAARFSQFAKNKIIHFEKWFIHSFTVAIVCLFIKIIWRGGETETMKPGFVCQLASYLYIYNSNKSSRERKLKYRKAKSSASNGTGYLIFRLKRICFCLCNSNDNYELTECAHIEINTTTENFREFINDNFCKMVFTARSGSGCRGVDWNVANGLDNKQEFVQFHMYIFHIYEKHQN